MGPGNVKPTDLLQIVRLSSLTAAANFVLPINAVIRDILIQETAGNAVTGGVSIGTTLAGTDVVTAQTVNASSLNFVTDATLLKCWFSTTVPQTLYIGAVVSWNSASINVTIYYYQNQLAA